MRPDRREQISFIVGVFTSLCLHAFFAILTIIILENSAARAAKIPEVFSVTIEGGEKLGGYSQAPKENGKKILTPEANQDPEESVDDAHNQKNTEPPEEKEKATKEVKEKVEEKLPEKKLTEPSVVDDPAKILAAKKLEEEKKKAEQEKKLQEEKAKKEKEKKAKEEADKLKQQEEKKKEESEKKKAEEDKKKERAERDKQLAESLKKLKNQYEGESADAGGKGFGAAALGGKGMGGGTLTSLEKLGYSNTLQRHVKQGWHWLGSTEKLTARVQVQILQNGQIQDVHIIQSSGNGNFDDSVVRAVFKASPVPPAPEALYSEFSTVIFTFDSSE